MEVDAVAHAVVVVDEGDLEDVADLSMQGGAWCGAAEGPHLFLVCWGVPCAWGAAGARMPD
ncbi:hypothetical protein [Streptomyces sp. DSM 40750]|uniref:hypothetical protein n=1 Tax=Streptomyces sp. DSM 40750 TaxID=2801030 RepID=UPI00214B71D2|nr:hypothetical protein [Streptomyces sp. DSM 40750]UUU19003.1 hypothetical protein JIX55_00815 [Streptomyces sp. DSM 40750]UUU27655.1 hypothetical protein JIX55_49935 [Streptomyces sp. DSM 40750]